LRPFSNLANVVFTRTYKRPRPTGGIESFSDVVERVVAGNVKGHNVSEQEISRLKYFLSERKAGPGGRGWWFSGTDAQAKLGGLGLVNCWTLAADDWMNFVVAQGYLMTGGGVGMTVEAKYSDKLPRVKKEVSIIHKLTKDADYIVPDSREGWCKLLQRVLEAWFVTGKGFTYSTICIRTAGEPIRGFGGVSSGPRPLVRMVEKICSILMTRQGRKLRPIDCADVLCCVGEMVVSGNVRRSAILILGDAHDKEFLKAKRWDLGPIPTQRAMANFSVNCSDSEHDLRPAFWKTYEAGEPFGIVNMKNLNKYGRMGELKDDESVCVNPCQPGWARVLTPSGIRTINDVSVGDLIWSGKKWTTVINKQETGVKSVKAYATTAGVFYGTENHRILSRGIKTEVGQAKTIDIAGGLGKFGFGKKDINPRDIMHGLVFGDGFYHKETKQVMLCIGKDDGDYHTSEISHLIGAHSSATEWYVNSLYVPDSHIPTRLLPDDYLFGRPESVCGFLRGLYSANGSVIRSVSGEIIRNRINLKLTCKPSLIRIQSMLSSLGLSSYYSTNKEHPVKFKNGTYICKEAYDLNISGLSSLLLFNQLIGFIQKYKNDKLLKGIDYVTKKSLRSKKTFEIKSVTDVSVEQVYSITVDDPDHAYWTDGLLVANCGEMSGESGKPGQGGGGEPCNLQDINLAALNDANEFEEAARLMHRWGKRVTCDDYYYPQSNEIIGRNRRIGTGITGCLMRPDLFNPDVLDRAYAAIQDENINYAKELGIPESIRTTVVKPSGTTSKAWDVPCEGIHPAFSRYFIQRIRIASNDALVQKLIDAGHHLEPQIRLDGTPDPDTIVADFYVETPEGVPTADEGFDTWKQLEAVQMAQKHWADQSISTTVYYNDSDIPKLQEWLKNNLDTIKTVSFLKYSNHGFKQIPKEKISKEQYEKLSAKVRPVEIEDISEGDMVDGGECAGACPIR